MHQMNSSRNRYYYQMLTQLSQVFDGVSFLCGVKGTISWKLYFYEKELHQVTLTLT